MDSAMTAKIPDLDIVNTVALLQSGDLSAEALAEALLNVADERANLNAFASLSDQLLADARRADYDRKTGARMGPLHGVPIALKDNINTAKLPTTGGTPALSAHRPREDAPVAKALFAAGALLMGKNTMQELAFGVTCRITPSGPVRNPYDLDVIPGGSSGGTAVAVAAGIVPAGIGTDTGGSVRVPAALCGLAGFRPSVGRWPAEGILPISHTRDTPGPIARSVRDLVLLDAIVTGDVPVPPRTDLHGVRLGLPHEYFWEGLDRDVESICRAAVENLRRAGADIIPIDLRDIDAQNAAVSFVVALHEPREDIPAYLKAAGSRITFDDITAQILSEDVRVIMASMAGEEGTTRAIRYREVISTLRPTLVANYFGPFAIHHLDALIFPTTPVPARSVNESNMVEIDGVALPAFGAYIRNTDPGSNAGAPGVTLNAGFAANGLPVGLALDGPPNGDTRLLSLAAGVEQVLTSMLPRL